MIRFLFLAFIITACGAFILSLVEPSLVGHFVFLVVSIFAAATVLKVSLDIYLHFKKEEEDEEEDREIAHDPEGQTFFELKDYLQARRERDSRRY